LSSNVEGKEREIAKRLLSWWKMSKRDYPWRKETDPYKILIAEIMLQRTKANQVMPVYSSFLERFPTPCALAVARIKDVKDFFRRLGLIWRAEKVRRLGDALVANFNSRVPNTREEMLSLPGVGEYAADAVLASAYGKNIAAVDANVCRAIGRLFGMEARGEARRDPKFREVARRLVPEGKAKEFNWAMIDFAALICKPRNPRCHVCPFAELCDYTKKRIDVRKFSATC